MANRNKKSKFFSLGDSNGSMMLEYVLMLSVAVVFLYCALEIFEPGAGYTDDLGKPLVAYFQRVLAGISLPIP